MRLPCPICGDRDHREFYYQGHAVALDRPARDAGEAAWDDYLHNRDNIAGEVEDLWHHEAGCGAWIKVTRNTVTHAISGAKLVNGART